ncbi:hypothetical protein FB451DRAFT_193172 [Mycena latifolia]|nr:hypothetical protein FB451DRAFT_193172 [Mycena latifolia]
MQNGATEPPAPPDLIREETLWFPDATLVIRAENLLFRVFPGILAAKSPVFHDMLAFPQPQNGETLDGCPLVHLTDSALDATHFLKAIFHYDFFEPWPAPADFPVVAGVLRLSQKYQVDPLKKRGLLHLSERCPMSVEEWNGHDWVHPSLLVSLARDISADWILPIALAACCWTLQEDLVNDEAFANSHSDLAPSDLSLCMGALSMFQTAWSTQVLDFLWIPVDIPRCSSPPECLRARLKRRQEAERWRADGVRVLNLWDQNDWDRLREVVCGACFAAMQTSHAHARRRYWDTLPSIFGLPDWPTLLEMKSAALA